MDKCTCQKGAEDGKVLTATYIINWIKFLSKGGFYNMPKTHTSTCIRRTLQNLKMTRIIDALLPNCLVHLVTTWLSKELKAFHEMTGVTGSVIQWNLAVRKISSFQMTAMLFVRQKYSEFPHIAKWAGVIIMVLSENILLLKIYLIRLFLHFPTFCRLHTLFCWREKEKLCSVSPCGSPLQYRCPCATWHWGQRRSPL